VFYCEIRDNHNGIVDLSLTGYEVVMISSYRCFRELAAGTFRAYSILVANTQKMETASSEMTISICRVSCSRRCEF